MNIQLKKLALVLVGLSVLLFQISCGSTSKSYSVPVINDINGGLTGSGTVGSLFIINGEGFANISAQRSDFSVDFRNASDESVVASTTINYAAGDWKDVFIKGTVPNGLNASTTYKVTVTTPGGTSNSANFLIVASVSFSPSTITWTSTSSLPQARQGFPTVIAIIGTDSYIYALGGNTANSTDANGKTLNASTVYSGVIDNTNGSIPGAWSTATALPAARGFSAGVVANGFNSKVSGNGTIYVLGGLDNTGSATSTVYYANLNSDGTIPASGTTGSWTATTPLPQALFAHGAVIFQGRIYVVGGNGTDGIPVSTVYSAVVKSDGTIGSWQTLSALPEGRAYHQLVTVADYLYVIGGDNTAVDPVTNAAGSSQSAIYYNQINLLDGSLDATWTTNSSGLTKSREKHTVVAAGSYLLVSGGLYSGNPGSSEQSYASVNSDGSVGSFNGATGSQTISGSVGGYDFFNQSTSYFVDASGNPHILILGGGDVNTGLLHSKVWYQH